MNVRKLFEQAAGMSLSHGWHSLSVLALCGAFLAGCTTQQNAPKTVVNQLRNAADHGNAAAANELGFLYLNGIQVTQDFTEARRWFEAARDHGNADGEFNLGVLYEQGKGVPKDQDEALRHFRTAVEHGSAAAKLKIGILSITGQGGVPRDEEAGGRLIHEAAVQGAAPAQMILGLLYETGLAGEPNDGEAYQWASLAAVKLNGQAGNIARGIREEAAKHLSATEISAAQALTANWKPGQDLWPLPSEPGAPPVPAMMRSSGSGFVVGRNGEIMTADHVVRHCREIHIRDVEAHSEAQTRVVREDKQDDLAVLAGVGFGTRLKLRRGPVEQGEAVVTYGFPLTPILPQSGNLTTGSVSATHGIGDSSRSFQISAPVQAGNSGGPVVDQSGAAIGIVVAKLAAMRIASATADLPQNVNFAVKVDGITTILDESNVGYELAGKGAAPSIVELGEKLKKSTVKVECWR